MKMMVSGMGRKVEVLTQALEYYEKALSYWEEFSKDDEEVAAMTFAIGTVSSCHFPPYHSRFLPISSLHYLTLRLTLSSLLLLPSFTRVFSPSPPIPLTLSHVRCTR